MAIDVNGNTLHKGDKVEFHPMSGRDGTGTIKEVFRRTVYVKHDKSHVTHCISGELLVRKPELNQL